MIIKPARLSGLYEIVGEPIVDHRGYMMRLFDDKIFAENGLCTTWVQESRSRGLKKNTMRGTHVPLMAGGEIKTISVMTGKIQWVVVDMRRNSSTFGQWESFVLSEEANNTLYVSKGFAHGNLSLSDNTDLLLRASNYFSDTEGTGIVWHDKDLKIEWMLDNPNPIIRERDANYPTFREVVEKIGGIDV